MAAPEETTGAPVKESEATTPPAEPVPAEGVPSDGVPSDETNPAGSSPNESENQTPGPESSGEESENNPTEQGIEQTKEPAMTVYHHFRNPFTGHHFTRTIPVITFSTTDFRSRNPYPQQPFANTDPLKDYDESQKRRQYHQDWLVSKLTTFENQLKPMMEKETNITVKNDIEELVGAVEELKQTLNNHQIFNITEVMNKWRESQFEQTNSKNEGDDSSNEKQTRNTVMKTFVLVPHSRIMPQTNFVPPSMYPSMFRNNFPVSYYRPHRPMFYNQYPSYPSNVFHPRSQSVETVNSLPQQPSQQEVTPSNTVENSGDNEIFSY